MFDIFRPKRASSFSQTWMMAQAQQFADALKERFQGLDAEIEALQASKADMHQEIERLKAQVKLIEHELAIAQRKSLAQKLRDKGVK